MNERPTDIERAFELARSGKYASVTEVRDALQAEGFDPKRLQGPSLQKQLRELCAQSRKNQPGGT
jgi:hypothetical protein